VIDEWRRWEGQVVNTLFPLLRLLTAADDDAVYLTESRAHRYAAIRIAKSDPASVDRQLAQWKAARALSHRRLLQVMEVGKCTLGDEFFIFMVTEYAEETLSEILPHRALTPDEAHALLLATLEGLAFLHGKRLVHGQLRPSNIVVVDDQLKLATHTIRADNEPTGQGYASSAYDAPELTDGRATAPGDMWSLGVTLREALTQTGVPNEAAPPHEPLPPPFDAVIAKCLRREPGERPKAVELEASLRRPVPDSTPEPPPPEAPKPEEPPNDTASESSRENPARRLAIFIAVVAVAAPALWFGRPYILAVLAPAPQVRVLAPVPATQSPAPAETMSAAQASVAPSVPVAPEPLPGKEPAQSAAQSYGALPAVTHEEKPAVSAGALATIHGRIRVTVRVSVGREGNVLDAVLEEAGPSKYFSHAATEAAKAWTFAPASGPSERLLQFAFTSDGATGEATVRP
jgi:TonB family protein